MPEFNAKNPEGLERRCNTKIRFTIGEWIKIISTVITLLTGAIFFYARTTYSIVDLQEKTTDAVKINFEQNKYIIELQKDVSYIKKSIDEMSDDQKEIKQLLYNLNGKLGEINGRNN